MGGFLSYGAFFREGLVLERNFVSIGEGRGVCSYPRGHGAVSIDKADLSSCVANQPSVRPVDASRSSSHNITTRSILLYQTRAI